MDKTQQSVILRNKLLKELERYDDLFGHTPVPSEASDLYAGAPMRMKQRIDKVMDQIVELYTQYDSMDDFVAECSDLVPIVNALSGADYSDGAFDFAALLKLADTISPLNVGEAAQDKPTSPASNGENPFTNFTPS